MRKSPPVISRSATDLETARLVLTPLRVEDTVPMLPVLGKPGLYEFTGGTPPTLDQLEARYRSQVTGSSTPGEAWFNWIMWLPTPATAIGFVQATAENVSAEMAWVVGVDWQGQGFAKEAAAAVKAWLSRQGVTEFSAHIHPEHIASQRVAAAVGLTATGRLDEDGEQIWSST